ncbi:MULTISPECIES: CopD family protein [unclassified Acidovorax]|uniref:CopD family protein n=1 Tax=unclassified Acidovorax TaxID=2684926 RepID=UPI00288353F4|nr:MULTISPECIES: CopD family protein [unclassified Acidovorax]
MLYALLKLAHLFAAIVWIGGMVFAHFFLRPAALALEPAARVPLMQAVLQRFFSAVTVAAAVMLASGLWMVGRVAKATVQAGGSFAMPLSWTVMATLGLVMIAIFGHIRFALYKRLRVATQAGDWAAGGKALASIRTWVGVNLALGVATVAVAVIPL